MELERLGPFRIKRVIGRGGMGAVYEAVHDETGVSAAIKVLLASLDDDAEVRLRFETEMSILTRLLKYPDKSTHPNIVQYLGSGEEPGKLYYAMEYVNGSTLQQELRKKRLFQWHEVAKIGLDICQALWYAHDRGVIHRDIKPANILLDLEGNIKLSDFGIARSFYSQQITDIHSVVGTLEFMSPEQANVDPITFRTDLYSLGCVLYMLLMNKPPFTARNLPELLRKYQAGNPPPIRSVRYDVPEELEILIADLLQFDPDKRPKNARVTANRFRSLLQALMGPPETIKVLPAPDEHVHLQPIELPPNSDITPIRPAWGVVVEDGLIDLGGRILPEDDVPTQNVVVNPQAMADAAAHSSLPREHTPMLMNSDAMNMGAINTDAMTADAATVAFSPEEQDIILQNRLMRQDIPADRQQTSVLTAAIRHGEVMKSRQIPMRHAEDEPLPDDNVFKPAPASGGSPPPPKEGNTSEKKSAVRQEGTAKKESATPYVSSDKVGDKVGEGAGLSEKVPVSRPYIPVSEKDIASFTGEDRENAPLISIPTIIMSLALIGAGLTFYYLLLPPSPESLYRQIEERAGRGRTDGGFSLDSLRSVRDDIQRFLAVYPNHTLAEQVQFYANELELTEQERRLERRSALSHRSLSPVERTYAEIITSLPDATEETAVRLRAFISVFQSAPPLPNKQLPQRGDTHALTPVELCVELARRRLAALESEMASAAVDVEQEQVIRKRLEEAVNLDATQPERAAEIRRGIIELYQHRPWAKDAVEEARKQLETERGE